MSLRSLRSVRLAGLRPESVALVLRECPKPHWLWLRDDPAIVWVSQRLDVRSLDLRPLVGLSVTAFVDDLKRRRAEITEAVDAVGGVLVGMADGERGEYLLEHPWPDLAAQTLVIERRHFWSIERASFA